MGRSWALQHKRVRTLNTFSKGLQRSEGQHYFLSSLQNNKCHQW
jgi:hypothetical protein